MMAALLNMSPRALLPIRHQVIDQAQRSTTAAGTPPMLRTTRARPKRPSVPRSATLKHVRPSVVVAVWPGGDRLRDCRRRAAAGPDHPVPAAGGLCLRPQLAAAACLAVEPSTVRPTDHQLATARRHSARRQDRRHDDDRRHAPDHAGPAIPDLDPDHATDRAGAGQRFHPDAAGWTTGAEGTGARGA